MLRPYVEMVHNKRAKHPDNTVWLMMEAKWNSLVDYCQETLASTPYMNRYNRRGMSEIRKLGINVEPKKVIDTVLACYLMYDLEGRRFRTDQSFRFQLVRRVRGLTTTNAKSWPTGEGGKRKLVYDELPPKANIVMSTLIIGKLGSTGVTFSRIVKEDEEKERKEKLAYFDALESLR
ncbi:hypothetical protein [Methylobacterium iners]|uniref:Uncharacterized protein n=1 Tax=Methylobacterium iners TaxID=418707 RepID=A0ABQ4RU15_9HYPH|nr:hypothetical protein [Methylobacterium iners]GJD93087.1 hypothetical protein OCOJLMKI_0274 [Methylobacterium iners]